MEMDNFPPGSYGMFIHENYTEMKYLHINYYPNENDGINLEIHYEFTNDYTQYDWLNFKVDELIDIIDHNTKIREYQIKEILENPKKDFLIDFIIEDLNEKVHNIVTIDFQDIVLKIKEEIEAQAEIARLEFNNPELNYLDK